MNTKRDWRAIFARWQPYGTLVVLCAAASPLPYSSFFILALIHWSALDALRMRKPARPEDWIASQAASIEAKHRFCGDTVTVTKSCVYRVQDRHYLVRVSRTDRDAEGRELV